MATKPSRKRKAKRPPRQDPAASPPAAANVPPGIDTTWSLATAINAFASPEDQAAEIEYTKERFRYWKDIMHRLWEDAQRALELDPRSKVVLWECGEEAVHVYVTPRARDNPDDEIFKAWSRENPGVAFADWFDGQPTHRSPDDPKRAERDWSKQHVGDTFVEWLRPIGLRVHPSANSLIKYLREGRLEALARTADDPDMRPIDQHQWQGRWLLCPFNSTAFGGLPPRHYQGIKVRRPVTAGIPKSDVGGRPTAYDRADITGRVVLRLLDMEARERPKNKTQLRDLVRDVTKNPELGDTTIRVNMRKQLGSDFWESFQNGRGPIYGRRADGGIVEPDRPMATLAALGRHEAMPVLRRRPGRAMATLAAIDQCAAMAVPRRWHGQARSPVEQLVTWRVVALRPMRVREKRPILRSFEPCSYSRHDDKRGNPRKHQSIGPHDHFYV